MGGRKWFVLAALFFAGPAEAEEDPNFDRLVRPSMEQFVDCAKAQVPAVAKTTAAASVAADNALGACKEERRVLQNIYGRPPYNQTPEQAEQIVNELVTAIRARMIEDIKAARQ